MRTSRRATRPCPRDARKGPPTQPRPPLHNLNASVSDLSPSFAAVDLVFSPRFEIAP